MNSKADSESMWKRWATQLARRRNLHVLTPDDATREFAAAKEIPLEEAEIESIVERVVSDELCVWEESELGSSWLDVIDSAIGNAALTDGLVDDEEHIDDEDDGKENHERLEGGDDPSKTPGGSK